MKVFAEKNFFHFINVQPESQKTKTFLQTIRENDDTMHKLATIEATLKEYNINMAAPESFEEY